MKYDVNKAFEGSNLSAQERKDILNSALDGIHEMLIQLENDCCYCFTCLKIYFRKDCNIDSRKIEKVVCTNPFTGGYLDRYEYEKQQVTEFCYICPEGHKIGEYKEYL